jgi:hypothetical protein
MAEHNSNDSNNNHNNNNHNNDNYQHHNNNTSTLQREHTKGNVGFGSHRGLMNVIVIRALLLAYQSTILSSVRHKQRFATHIASVRQ